MAQQSLGEMLVRAGVISEEGLHRARKMKQRWGGSLARHLVDMQLADEQTLNRALSKIYKLATVDLDPLAVDHEVAQMVPREVAEAAGLIAFRHEPQSQTIHIAMADPSDLSAVDQVRLATGCHVKVHIAPSEAVLRAVNQCYYGDTAPYGEEELELETGALADSPLRTAGLSESARRVAHHDTSSLRPRRRPSTSSHPVQSEESPSGLIDVELDDKTPVGADSVEIDLDLEPLGTAAASVSPGDEPPARAPSRPADDPQEQRRTVQELRLRVAELEKASALNRLVLERLLRLLIKRGLVDREDVRKLLDR